MNMQKMFENFDIWKDDSLQDEQPFIVACKDREAIDGERWVLASLTNEEAKKIYEYLGEHLKEETQA